MAKRYCKPWPAYPKFPFYGLNGHLGWENTVYKQANWPAIAAQLRALGARVFRNAYSATYSTTDGSITSSRAGTFQAWMAAYPDIMIYPVLTPQYVFSWVNATTPATESTAYTMGFNLGVDAATALSGKVPGFGIGNEYAGSYWSTANGWDNKYMVSNAGTAKSDYDNAKYLVCRGSVRGLYDGIRSVDKVTPICSPAGEWIHSGFHDMLRDGSTPNAPTTYDLTKLVDWQITDWHWYTQYSTASDNCEALVSQPYTNLLAKLATYGRPLLISEFGTNTYNSSNVQLYPNDAAIQAALISSGYLYDKWLAAQNTYASSGMPIIGCIQYQLADATGNQASPTIPQNEMGFGLNDQTLTPKSWLNAIQAFAGNHPVTGF